MQNYKLKVAEKPNPRVKSSHKKGKLSQPQTQKDFVGLVFTPKRNKLTDRHFEMLVFLKMNKEVMTTW